MTHKSDFAYGARPLPEPHSGARSGEVRVRYFDPVTGRPCERRPATRTAQLRAAGKQAPRTGGGSWNFKQRKGGWTPCEVDGAAYESIAAASRATGIRYAALQSACRDGSAAAAGHAVSFAKRERP